VAHRRLLVSGHWPLTTLRHARFPNPGLHTRSACSLITHQDAFSDLLHVPYTLAAYAPTVQHKQHQLIILSLLALNL
jgi:hypothetical protein